MHMGNTKSLDMCTNTKNFFFLFLFFCKSNVTCHLSCVACHVSPLMCHLSCDTCHVSHVTSHSRQQPQSHTAHYAQEAGFSRAKNPKKNVTQKIIETFWGKKLANISDILFDQKWPVHREVRRVSRTGQTNRQTDRQIDRQQTNIAKSGNIKKSDIKVE